MQRREQRAACNFILHDTLHYLKFSHTKEASLWKTLIWRLWEQLSLFSPILTMKTFTQAVIVFEAIYSILIPACVVPKVAKIVFCPLN